MFGDEAKISMKPSTDMHYIVHAALKGARNALKFLRHCIKGMENHTNVLKKPTMDCVIPRDSCHPVVHCYYILIQQNTYISIGKERKRKETPAVKSI